MSRSIEVLFLILFAVESAISQQGSSLRLTGPYLGQAPPGMLGEIFAPGIISKEGSNEFCASFSPDGKEFYFNRGMTIMVCSLQRDGWTAPKPASFNGDYRNHTPHLAFDNRRMFFGGSRPPQPYGIWLTERISNRWSDPQRMWDGMYATSAKNGNIYFGVEFPPPAHIVMTRLTDTGYASLTKQEITFADPRLEHMSIFHPAIAPDQSFLVFDDNEELYVSFRQTDGQWGSAISLGSSLKEQPATIPAVSPDGRYLFYASQGDLFWVSTSILDKLRPPTKSHYYSAPAEGDSMVKRETRDSIALTILYDNRSVDDSIIADHGFSCLVESGGRACLFDAGRIADTFMTNAKTLGVDFSRITQVFISHFHDDHMGELIRVLGACNKPQLYLPFSYPQFPNEPLAESAEREFGNLQDRYRPLVSEIIRTTNSVAIEGKYYSTGTIENITYEQSLLIPTSKGLIILIGCAHPGIVEIVRHSKKLMKQDVYCILGGFHLVSTDSPQLRTIARELRKLTKYLGPCHCTGAKARAIFRDIFQDEYLDIHAGKKLQFNDGIPH